MNNTITTFLNKETKDTDIYKFLIEYITQNKIQLTSELVNNLTKEFINLNYGEGNIYCIHNKMYESHGKNVYKLRCSKNVNKRFLSYATYYITPCVLKYVSPKIKYYGLIEQILFAKLAKYRINTNRELDIIKREMDFIIKEIECVGIVSMLEKYKICIVNIENIKKYITCKIHDSKNRLNKLLIFNTSNKKITKEDKKITKKNIYLKNNGKSKL